MKNNNLFSLDLEASGLSPTKNSILSIGAIHIETGNEFYVECRNYPDREVDDFALKVNGFTLEQANDITKPFPHEVYVALVTWCLTHTYKPMLIGENLPSFDVQFLKYTQELTVFPWVFGHRYLDLHSISFAHFGRSVKMDEALVLLGLPPEPRPHNALTGAKVTRDVFKKLMGDLWMK